MGYSILELVLRRLREEGFAASAAYPGQVFPQIEGTVAAVHIEEVDRANLSVTIEISIITPASLGGTACEVEALKATEVLRWAGAVCIQKGCTYDGVARVYLVSILATFTGVTEADSCVIWPGFYCYVDSRFHSCAMSFTAEEQITAEPVYAMGENAPTDIAAGDRVWKIRLEELIPCGTAEPEEPTEPFEVRIISELKTEIYTGCRWTKVSRERSAQGLRRIRAGYALTREEEV